VSSFDEDEIGGGGNWSWQPVNSTFSANVCTFFIDRVGLSERAVCKEWGGGGGETSGES
jgi:hypothetical protein